VLATASAEGQWSDGRRRDPCARMAATRERPLRLSPVLGEQNPALASLALKGYTKQAL